MKRLCELIGRELPAVEAGRIRISEGNRKMGSIPSVSLPAVLSCDPAAPCAVDGTCYVVANMYRGPWWRNVLQSHLANFALWNADPESYFAQLSGWIERRRPELFRVHVSGDCPTEDYMNRVFKLGHKLICAGVETRVLMFTKRFGWLPPRQRGIPANVSVVASGWHGMPRPPKGYRVAWMMDPADPDSRIPKSALRCPGGCESCGMCWDIYKLKRDVYFHKH